jgi:RHS repeat-associated protein
VKSSLVQTTDPLGTTNYLYDGASIFEELDSGGSIVARYTQGQNISETLAQLRSGTISYYNADGLGSVTSLTNPLGTTAATYGYDAFGELSASSGSLINAFRYSGEEFDVETGLYYYRARYYDPAAGRFFSEDPLAAGGGDLNLYAYVRNRPNNVVDPSGLGGKNPFNQWWDGLKRNGNFLSNWFWESNNFGDATSVQFHGKDFLYYGPNTAETQDMMNSAGGLYMQLLHKYKFKCSGSHDNNDFPTIPAYLTTIEDPSNAAFQVGAFSFDITEMEDGTVQYTMYNKAGWYSLLGGLNFGLGDHDRESSLPVQEMNGFGGNVRQMFQWKGKKPCGCQ